MGSLCPGEKTGRPGWCESVGLERKLMLKMSSWLVLVMLGTSLVQAQDKAQVKSQGKPVSVWNTKKYPICLVDSDCDSISKRLVTSTCVSCTCVTLTPPTPRTIPTEPARKTLTVAGWVREKVEMAVTGNVQSITTQGVGSK